MKKLFFALLLCANFSFGSGVVREQFNADQLDREKLISGPKESIVARLKKLWRKN
ncbi:hypothetical protein KBB68_04005 [Candidatus Babeliales bacterium]|nr:hypothetical protein [Candidatus Babeliales bacterium]